MCGCHVVLLLCDTDSLLPNRPYGPADPRFLSHLRPMAPSSRRRLRDRGVCHVLLMSVASNAFSLGADLLKCCNAILRDEHAGIDRCARLTLPRRSGHLLHRWKHRIRSRARGTASARL